MAGRAADEGGRKPAGSGAQKGSVRARKLQPRGTEIAAVERREAPAFSKGNAARRKDPVRRLALHSLGLKPRGEKRRPAYPAPQRIGAAERWLARRSLGGRSFGEGGLFEI